MAHNSSNETGKPENAQARQRAQEHAVWPWALLLLGAIILALWFAPRDVFRRLKTQHLSYSELRVGIAGEQIDRVTVIGGRKITGRFVGSGRGFECMVPRDEDNVAQSLRALQPGLIVTELRRDPAQIWLQVGAAILGIAVAVLVLRSLRGAQGSGEPAPGEAFSRMVEQEERRRCGQEKNTSETGSMRQER